MLVLFLIFYKLEVFTPESKLLDDRVENINNYLLCFFYKRVCLKLTQSFVSIKKVVEMEVWCFSGVVQVTASDGYIFLAFNIFQRVVKPITVFAANLHVNQNSI